MSAPSVLRVGRPPPRPSPQAKLEELGAANVLCVLSTTSCFAPRAVEKLLPIGRLCRDADVPHIANNAYGVQCAACMKAIAAASRHGRLDAFVQSTDKNFLVPVGGAIVATASKDHGGPLLKTIKATYPGRASISPVLDLFTTLLHLGASGWAPRQRERTHQKSRRRRVSIDWLALGRARRDVAFVCPSLHHRRERSSLSFITSASAAPLAALCLVASLRRRSLALGRAR